MLYTLEQGPTEKKILTDCYRQRLPIPPKIANAPELTVGLELFYHAFQELTTCRAIGWAEGPIPWLAIHEYCKVNGIEDEQRDDMFFHVSCLDIEYLKWRSKQVSEKK